MCPCRARVFLGVGCGEGEEGQRMTPIKRALDSEPSFPYFLGPSLQAQCLT